MLQTEHGSSAIKTQDDRRCKARNEITKWLYRIPLRKKRAQKTKTHAAKQKIECKFKINVSVHNTSINRASSFYELIRRLQAKLLS